ncbi:hydrogen peroxide-inducible genes activator [Neotamlana laminarinivorans]|uniref:LysR family transcriptional regulator n=1 Tax=Neotamlana laminarinivorans TaxID=2883124 RepID=A0A9X1L4Q7_9FLAO|nr:hydrogen peroxide-inducible genes activator [Tamlana laminarinivorans]MCB4799587.1 LysR family transcriptional regulator [Tamlana laminarinivorans]
MTIQQLKYIVALDNFRNFVKASESCNVAQPTLTLQVKKLEDQIGLILFDRTSQPLKPTPLGKDFIKKSRDILVLIDELKGTVNDEKTNMNGTFSIGIIPTLAPYLLPLFIKEFLEKHTQTKLKILELHSEDIIEKLEKQQLDIGILATPLNEKNIIETPLFYEPFLVYTDNIKSITKGKNKISSEDLKPEGLWLLAKGHCFRDQMLKLCELKNVEFERNILMEGGSIETLKPLINKISGYTLIPELSYNEATDKKHIVRFESPEPVREISIVTHKNFTKEALITALRKSILKHTPEAFKKNSRFVKINWR